MPRGTTRPTLQWCGILLTQCPRCGIFKPGSSYYRRGDGYLVGSCKACRREIQKAYEHTPERTRARAAYAREYVAARPRVTERKRSHAGTVSIFLYRGNRPQFGLQRRYWNHLGRPEWVDIGISGTTVLVTAGTTHRVRGTTFGGIVVEVRRGPFRALGSPTGAYLPSCNADGTVTLRRLDPPADRTNLYTPRQLADALQSSQSRLLPLLRKGQLDAVREQLPDGLYYRVMPEEIERVRATIKPRKPKSA